MTINITFFRETVDDGLIYLDDSHGALTKYCSEKFDSDLKLVEHDNISNLKNNKFDLIIVEDDVSPIKDILAAAYNASNIKNILICFRRFDLERILNCLSTPPVLLTLDFELKIGEVLDYSQMNTIAKSIQSYWGSTTVLGISNYINKIPDATQLEPNVFNEFKKSFSDYGWGMYGKNENTFEKTLPTIFSNIISLNNQEINISKTNISEVNLIGTSNELNNIKRRSKIIAQTDSSVLITGETGTGKELVATIIHDNSGRSNLVPVNCAGGVGDINMEKSKYFGHKKGAFTGATEDKKGYFQQAHGGTIFLDEIGDISLDIQGLLLRVLEDGKVTKVGATQEENVDVRIIGATNKNIDNLITEGKFRKDFYYRINQIPVSISPLRKRKEDIKSITNYLLAKKIPLEKGYSKKTIEDDSVYNILENQLWLGNVRELEKCLKNAVLFSEGQYLNENDIISAINSTISSSTVKETKSDIIKINEKKKFTLQMQDKLDKYELSLKIYKKLNGAIVINNENHDKEIHEMMTRYSNCQIDGIQVVNFENQSVLQNDVGKLDNIRKRLYIIYPPQRVGDVDPEGFQKKFGISTTPPKQKPFRVRDGFPKDFDLNNDDYINEWPLLRLHWKKMK